MNNVIHTFIKTQKLLNTTTDDGEGRICNNCLKQTRQHPLVANRNNPNLNSFKVPAVNSLILTFNIRPHRTRVHTCSEFDSVAVRAIPARGTLAAARSGHLTDSVPVSISRLASAGGPPGADPAAAAAALRLLIFLLSLVIAGIGAD